MYVFGPWYERKLMVSTMAPPLFDLLTVGSYSQVSLLFMVCIYSVHGMNHLATRRCFLEDPPNNNIAGQLLHITIQCPVYNESLAGVIIPTVESLKVAISTYELQGGTERLRYLYTMTACNFSTGT
jgi:hypothetical protein